MSRCKSTRGVRCTLFRHDSLCETQNVPASDSRTKPAFCPQRPFNLPHQMEHLMCPSRFSSHDWDRAHRKRSEAPDWLKGLKLEQLQASCWWREHRNVAALPVYMCNWTDTVLTLTFSGARCWWAGRWWAVWSLMLAAAGLGPAAQRDTSSSWFPSQRQTWSNSLENNVRVFFLFLFFFSFLTLLWRQCLQNVEIKCINAPNRRQKFRMIWKEWLGYNFAGEVFPCDIVISK